jgi:predicted S18 family serine protease
LKNVTIKLENDVAHWSKVWAAEHNTSVSKILGDLLKQLKREKMGYAKSMHQFMSTEASPLKNSGQYPSRQDLYER